MAASNPAFERKIREAKALAAESVDGFARSPDLEEKINGVCRTVLNGPAGEQLMSYLKSITVDVVEPPSASDAQLRTREGMRRLVGILDTRRKSTPKKEG